MPLSQQDALEEIVKTAVLSPYNELSQCRFRSKMLSKTILKDATDSVE